MCVLATNYKTNTVYIRLRIFYALIRQEDSGGMIDGKETNIVVMTCSFFRFAEESCLCYNTF